jgi:hypothetical protein
MSKIPGASVRFRNSEGIDVEVSFTARDLASKRAGRELVGLLRALGMKIARPDDFVEYLALKLAGSERRQ